jgi:hypothetical protein
MPGHDGDGSVGFLAPVCFVPVDMTATAIYN